MAGGLPVIATQALASGLIGKSLIDNAQDTRQQNDLLSAKKAYNGLLLGDMDNKALPVPNYKPVPSVDPNTGALIPGTSAPSAADQRVGLSQGGLARALVGAGADPVQLWQLQQAAQQKANEPYTLNAGDVRMAGGRQIASAPFAPQKPDAPPAAVDEYNFAKKQGFPGSFMDFVTQKAAAGQQPAKPDIQEIFDPKTGRPIKVRVNQDGTYAPIGGVSTPAKTFNNDQNKAAGFANSMQTAEDNITSLGNYDPTETGQALGGLTNASSSAEFQKFDQAKKDWSLALLRFESGANVPDAEAAKYEKTYFPQYGDSNAVIKQKALARAEKLKAVIAASGGAYDTLGSSNVAPQAAKSSAGAPPAGAIEDGYRFKGGNPADPSSWEQVR